MTRSSSMTILKTYRKALTILITPLLCSLMFLAGTGKDVRCAYVVTLMSVFWMTDALPLAITAFLPVVLFPLTGVMSAKDVAPHYLKDNNFLFVGSLLMAVAVEESRLHERLALSILLLVGTKPRWLLLGFMGATAFLSMWMSNTATTAMMLPIALAVAEQTKMSGRFDRALLLSICYSANIGGIATLTGTGTNIVLSGQLHALFPDQHQLSFLTWMAFAVPPVLVSLLMAWLWIQLLFVRSGRSTAASNMDMTFVLKDKYKTLGPIRWHEGIVFCMFLVLVMLWLFRDPQIFPGWGVAFPNDYVSDGTSAMVVAILLFVLPRKTPSLRNDYVYEPLMTWGTVKAKFEWGTVMLLGGGYAMAAGVQSSGLSDVISEQLSSLNSIPDWLFLLLAVSLVTFLTEFSSNAATASIFLPLMATLAVAQHKNPLYYMLPVSMACSFAFMLPVATPPNAIVYSAGVLRATDMALAGLGMNLGCILVSVVTAQTWGFWLFSFGTFPDWANDNVTMSTTYPTTAANMIMS